MSSLPELNNEEPVLVPEFRRWKYYVMVITGYLLLLLSYLLISFGDDRILDLFNGMYIELPPITQKILVMFGGGWGMRAVVSIILLIMIYGVHLFCRGGRLRRFLFPIILLSISSSVLATIVVVWGLILPILDLCGKFR